MKMRYIAPLAMAATAAAVGFAPIAAAAPTNTGDATVVQNPGNAQITAQPGQSAQNASQLQQPFGGDMAGLLFHH